MTDIATVTPDQVASAYEGRANKCACGCSGTYYGPEYTGPGKVISDAKVTSILKRIQKRAVKAAAGEVEALWEADFSDGAHCWAYQTKTMLIRIETKGAAK